MINGLPYGILRVSISGQELMARRQFQGSSFHFSERQDTQSLLRLFEHDLLLRIWTTLRCIALKSLRECNFNDVVNWYVFITGSIFQDDYTWF
jgi:hypothetical protein